MRRRAASPLAVLLALLLLPACRRGEGAAEASAEAKEEAAAQAVAARPPAVRDLPAIREEGKLRVVFTFNSTGYFIYRGEVMGFEFRLLRKFAEDHGLELVPRVTRDRREIFDLLNGGAGDVIAARLLKVEVDLAPTQVVATRPLYATPPVLVQEIRGLDDPQLPEPVEDIVEEHRGREVAEPEREERREMEAAPRTAAQLKARLLTRPRQLGGRTVHLERGSSYVHLLAELQDQTTGEIRVVELEQTLSPEKAIEEVAQQVPRYTVAPENVANLQEEYYVNVEAMPLLGPPDPVVWAVRGNAPELHGALQEWLAKNAARIAAEYRTYFEERAGFHERVASEYLTSATGRLSRHDELLKKAASEIDWDWRLLASQAFQESRFDADARSWAGAVGLLQIMPRTAREVGVEDLRDPQQNAAGAVRYLRKLDLYWQKNLPGLDQEARLPFVLASYNVGAGHVQDARRLAEKNGDDPASWPDVAYWLLRKSEAVVYSDPVVRFGYARGIEPVTYVELILERYRHYLDFVDSGEPPQGVGSGKIARAAEADR